MDRNKSLSEFTNKAKGKMGDVLGEEEYAKPIANSLGKNWIESFKKFMSPKKIAEVVKKVQIGFVSVELRNPAETMQAKTAKEANEPEIEM